MKKTAILLSIFFIGFSQAQTPIDQDLQAENQKKESKKKSKSDPDARIFILKKQKEVSPNSNSIIKKEEILKNKKGYKRVNRALNKEMKIKKRKEKKSIKTQNKMFNKYIKQSKKRHKKLKKEAKKSLQTD